MLSIEQFRVPFLCESYLFNFGLKDAFLLEKVLYSALDFVKAASTCRELLSRLVNLDCQSLRLNVVLFKLLSEVFDKQGVLLDRLVGL